VLSRDPDRQHGVAADGAYGDSASAELSPASNEVQTDGWRDEAGISGFGRTAGRALAVAAGRLTVAGGRHRAYVVMSEPSCTSARRRERGPKRATQLRRLPRLALFPRREGRAIQRFKSLIVTVAQSCGPTWESISYCDPP
jgi:hypothetical protein